MLIFAHGIKTNARSTLELRSLINSAVTPDVQTEENIVPVFGSYELRGRRVAKSVAYNIRNSVLGEGRLAQKFKKKFKTS